MTMVLSTAVAAADTVVVTPTNQQGWQEENLADGDVEFVADGTLPNGGEGALELRTPSALAKANYYHLTNTALSNVTELSYYTRQMFAPVPTIAAVSYQLGMCLNGTAGGTACVGFTTLVFEPYQNPLQGPIVPGVWQSWDVDAGLFWSTQTVACSNGVVAGTPGGPATYTLAAIESMCPQAVVFRFAANAGRNNPGWVVRTDLFNFNGTTYDFELTNEPNDKDDCKKGGWMTHARADGSTFKNQGDCIQYANTGK